MHTIQNTFNCLRICSKYDSLRVCCALLNDTIYGIEFNIFTSVNFQIFLVDPSIETTMIKIQLKTHGKDHTTAIPCVCRFTVFQVVITTSLSWMTRILCKTRIWRRRAKRFVQCHGHGFRHEYGTRNIQRKPRNVKSTTFICDCCCFISTVSPALILMKLRWDQWSN